MTDEQALPGVLEAEGLKIIEGIQDIELDPTEVDKLFHIENPLELSDAQRAVVVEALRRARSTYLVAKEKKKAKKEKKKVTEIGGITLADLDMDLDDLLKKVEDE